MRSTGARFGGLDRLGDAIDPEDHACATAIRRIIDATVVAEAMGAERLEVNSELSGRDRLLDEARLGEHAEKLGE